VQAFDDFVAGRALRPVVDPQYLTRAREAAVSVARALPSGT
jgi:hypothetical protein